MIISSMPNPPLFHGRHFDRSVIIILCVRWCVTFKLSFRDLVEVMAELGADDSSSAVVATQLPGAPTVKGEAKKAVKKRAA